MIGTEMKKTENRFSILNSESMKAVDNINDSLMLGAIEHLSGNGFRWIDVPTMTKITGACENVDTLYAVEHFGRTAYLAQTGQLYLEAKIKSHKKVWTVIHSTRAEAAVDSRHLNQFHLIEFEHAGNFEELLKNIEGTVKAMVQKVLDNNTADLEFLGRDIEHLRSYLLEFGRITYTEAVDMLRNTELEVEWGDDLTHLHEQFLVQENGNRPLFITHYPREIKFFNMRVNDENPKVVNSADLILPYSGEAVGSAERENNYERLVSRLEDSTMFRVLKKRGITMKEFEEYLNLVKMDPILHSGCGIGFTRVSQSVMGFDDIRMATSYPINSSILY